MSSRRRDHSVAGLLVACALLAGCSKAEPVSAGNQPSEPTLPLTLVADISLPGGTTRLDYQDIDPDRQRLYIAHLGDSTVHVVDLNSMAVVATIDGVGSAHGVRVAPDLHEVLATASATNEAVIIDESTLAISSRAPTGDTPDGIGYDPTTHKAYVSNEHDKAETVIDARTGKTIATIDIGGEAGNTAYDPHSGHILVNVQDRNQIAVIDPASDQVIDRIGVTDCDTNHGLYIDSDSRVAFVACQGNAKVLVVDLDSKQTTARFDIGASPDVLAFDYGLHRLYVAAESGTVSVFDETGKSLHKVAEAKLADTAHTVAVDQATHRVYFPLENVDGHPVLRVMEPTPDSGQTPSSR
jgi:DNA-binding beta-propeller fold protein YncE